MSTPIFFSDIDKDDNDYISSDEQAQYETYLLASKIIQAVDLDGDGQLNYDEFDLVLFKLEFNDFDYKGKFTKEEIEIFNSLDKDGNGFVTVADHRGPSWSMVTTEDIKRRIKDYDIDGDGQWNIEEFVKMIKKFLTQQPRYPPQPLS